MVHSHRWENAYNEEVLVMYAPENGGKRPHLMRVCSYYKEVRKLQCKECVCMVVPQEEGRKENTCSK
jgi:hypothetical protein